jgi:voltage-gated potassium channel
MSLSQIATGLGVRIYREGTPHGFWEAEAQALIPGDVIVEIMPTMPRESDLG